MIIVVSRIKNAADIIESFIRGNSFVADKFILYDNGSADTTVEILNNLIAEGLDIEILRDSNFLNRQKTQIQSLINYAKEKYDPDIILPLDDDEILASEMVMDIKNYLLSLPQDKIYKVRWRVYTPVGREDERDPCPIRRITHCYINNEYDFPTVVLTREILKYDTYVITQGNHGLNWTGKWLPPHDVEFLNKLYLAHYPIRSEAQAISKFLVGWTNYLATPLKDDMKQNSYWYKIYEKIKYEHKISYGDMIAISGYYRQKRGDGTEFLDQIANQRIYLPSSAFEIRYPAVVDPLYNYMCDVEDIAVRLASCFEKEGMEKFGYDFGESHNKM